MSLRQSELVELGRRHLYQNYRQPDLVLARGRGSELWDVEGRRYLDMAAGIAVNSLGHAHPRLVETLARQAATLSHVSNYFFNEPNVLLAAELCRRSGMDRALFCNSGTEAIEASLKLVRRHFYATGEVERHRILAFQRSFHGRTMGALAATGQEGYREGFGPLGAVTHVPFGDLARVEAAMAPDVAAILVEPVQGEGGVIPAPDGFLAGLRRIADAHGAFLIADEIQTGIGRTGKLLAFEHWDVRADVVALAKGLGGGFPIGAMLCSAALEQALPPGSHGSTFGGNPLASAVALTVLEVIESDGLLGHALETGHYLASRLRQLHESYPRHVAQTRGLGLLQAIELVEGVDARSVLGQLRDAGVILTLAGGSALRFSPPLVVTRAEIDEACDVIARILEGLP